MTVFGIDYATGPDVTVTVDITPNDRGGYSLSIPHHRYGKPFSLQVGNFASLELALERIEQSAVMRLGTIHNTNPADKQS